jgi:murein DD-endopeptidase MepM/ murein hydrolase activator NlpD
MPQNARRRPSMTAIRRRRQNMTILFIIATIALVLFTVLNNDNQSTPRPISETELSPATFAEPNADAIIQIKRDTICQDVRPGDTITAILGHYFSPAEILTIARQSKAVFPLTNLCAGHPYQIEIENDNFVTFSYDINNEEQLIIQQQDGQFNIYRQEIPYDIKVEPIGAKIHSSLFQAVDGLGESSELARRLMNIFAWDVDFIRDIRDGDYFSVLIEKRYRDGNLAGYGDLLAAEFSNNDHSYYAFNFQDASGQSSYFDNQGKSLRKAFLKAPLTYTRISSGYTNRRFHPVLNKWKPHLAIDYAAPVGTPVKAVANGTVTQKSYDKYNGNKIRIRHPNSYETTYIHLSKFARGIKKGSHVRQGEVIAYVGATGIATGPHLDFRVFKNGKAINPLKMKSTPGQPISADNKDRFAQIVARRTQKLSAIDQQITATEEDESISD